MRERANTKDKYLSYHFSLCARLRLWYEVRRTFSKINYKNKKLTSMRRRTHVSALVARVAHAVHMDCLMFVRHGSMSRPFGSIFSLSTH